jgi:hypothetical protein
LNDQLSPALMNPINNTNDWRIIDWKAEAATIIFN